MNVMGVIPGFLLWCSREGGVFDKYPLGIDLIRSFPGGLLVGSGACLCWISVSLFSEHGGGGTPAPYDPPKIFVARGVYTRVRNPMMTGVILVLSGGSDALRFDTYFNLVSYFYSRLFGFDTLLGRTRTETQVW